MNNNDILRRIRYVFDIDDSDMITTFGEADLTVTRAQISDWLKKDDDPDYQICSDVQMAAFLNGLIIRKRGKQDGPPRAPEKRLNNNIVFMKLKIAMNLKADEVIELVNHDNLNISKHELSAFFRKPGHRHYRECKDQVLRHFLKGMQYKYRA